MQAIFTHILQARVVTHMLARVIMHVHDYHLKTCVLVAISSCSIGPFSLQKFFTEDILYAFVLSPGFISENFVSSEIYVEKKQVNTGITRMTMAMTMTMTIKVDDGDKG